MVKKQYQSGSAHLIIVAVLSLALISSLGYIFWQNYNKPKNTVANAIDSKTPATEDKTTTTTEETKPVDDIISTYSANDTESLKEFCLKGTTNSKVWALVFISNLNGAYGSCTIGQSYPDDTETGAAGYGIIATKISGGWIELAKGQDITPEAQAKLDQYKVPDSIINAY